ncbi:choice-of-anchor I family protein [Synechocystis sp. LKSZ1]|uniref:choice-of-anchor I family protein n=1 Tax=Synechocystis sp. LKSZ1 TaxID=3144951 RepID=UPI00336BF814
MTTTQGTPGNDLLIAGLNFDGFQDLVLGLGGNDEIDAGSGTGRNILSGGPGNDTIFVNNTDRAYGDEGDDVLDAGDGSGNNALYGGLGNDVLYAGTGDKLYGGPGNDTFFPGLGSSTFWGGTGLDRFWLAVAEAPNPFNTVVDFTPNNDQLAIALTGVSQLSDLTFSQQGADTQVSLTNGGQVLALLKGVNANQLNAGNVLINPETPNAPTTPSDNSVIQLSVLGTYATGRYNESAAEIPAYDPATRRLFVVNAQNSKIDVLDASNPSNPTLITSIDISRVTQGGSPNSVTVKNGLVAIAVQAKDPQANGQVVFYQASSLDFQLPLKNVTVGALPDMLTFTPDGKKVLTANEGEPNEAYTIDPEGSVSIINLSNGVNNAQVTTAGFTAFNDQKAALQAAGVRIIGPNATVAQDLEPEYIAVSPDGLTATITLQENNALAFLNLATGTITNIKPLGLKDFNQFGNTFDPSDRDVNFPLAGSTGAINLLNWPVFGMYQPDGIASYSVNGQVYYITANEGDARIRPTANGIIPGVNEGGIFNEEVRVGSSSYVLDPTVFPNAAELKLNQNLGRLTVTNKSGDTDGDGDFDQIVMFGSRSFSIWDANGNLVFDSGDDLELITAANFPANFNASNTNNTLDDRSDNKGPEPEGVVLGKINDRTYAFIGLERIGGVMVYDVTNPVTPQFLQYINNRDFNTATNTSQAGDLGPEGLIFVPAVESPTGKPMLVVANEVSGTSTLYDIAVPGPAAVNTPPTVVNVAITGNEDSLIPFSLANFTAGFTDVDGNPLTKVKIVSLPNNGTLRLGDTNVAVGQEITSAAVETLTFAPSPNFVGTTSFSWNGFDGTVYATNPAQASITLNNQPEFISISTNAQVAYIAYYGRPGDVQGLNFWNNILIQSNFSYAPVNGDFLTGNEAATYNNFVNSFGNSEEANRLYAGKTDGEVIDFIYNATFNRTPEAGGKAFWAEQLANGNLTRPELALQIALNAKNDDVNQLNNKIASAGLFTSSIDTPEELAANQGARNEPFSRQWLDPFGLAVSTQIQVNSGLNALVNNIPLV